MNAAYGGTGEVAGWTHVKDYLVGDRTSVSALRAESARVRGRSSSCYATRRRRIARERLARAEIRDGLVSWSLTVDRASIQAGAGLAQRAPACGSRVTRW